MDINNYQTLQKQYNIRSITHDITVTEGKLIEIWLPMFLYAHTREMFIAFTREQNLPVSTFEEMRAALSKWKETVD